MESCVFHPDHSAAEHCELCGRALCGLCLWYDDGGRRLCETHATEMRQAGGHVLPPETYAEGIGGSLVARRNAAVTSSNGDTIRYKGNREDLNALLAATIALATLFSCMGGAYCLPVAAVILGATAYANASKAVDPSRTRKLAGIGIAVGGGLLLLVLTYVGLFVAILFFGILSSSGGP